jgi:hypothetical protein
MNSSSISTGREPERAGYSQEGVGGLRSQRTRRARRSDRLPRRIAMSKSADKPKKQQGKKPQKTLKERRSEKRAAKRSGPSSLAR